MPHTDADEFEAPLEKSPMIPRCPKCGEPPRFRRATCVVKIEVWREKDVLVEGVAKHIGKPLPGHEAEYECGGGHRWSHSR